MSEYISKEEFVSRFRKLICEDCNHRKAYRNGKLINRFIYEIGGPPCRACAIDDMIDRVEDFPPADVAPVPRWIPVTERLPSENGLYLCCWKAQCDDQTWIIRLADWRADTGWMNMHDEPMKKPITHWMPLPEPPEEVDE